MKRYCLAHLDDAQDGHFLSKILQGPYLRNGGIGFKRPGQRTHGEAGPDGSDRHVHDDHEAFVILQGKGVMEIDGKRHSVTTGDIIIVEPGEDHHLIADVEDPCVNLWLHAGPRRHPDQES